MQIMNGRGIQENRKERGIFENYQDLNSGLLRNKSKHIMYGIKALRKDEY